MSISSLIGCFFQRPPPPTYLSTKKITNNNFGGIQIAHNSSFQKKCLHAILLLTETLTKQWKWTRSLCVRHPWHSESIPYASKTYEESHSSYYKMWSREDRTENSYKRFCPSQVATPNPLSTALGCFWQCGTKQRADGKTWPTLYHWKRRETLADGSKINHLE